MLVQQLVSAWLLLLARNSARMKFLRPLARGAWARCIARGTRVSTAPSTEGTLMSAKVNLGNRFEAMTPVALFQSRRRQKISSQDAFTYAVSDDGDRFLFNTIVDRRQATPLWIMQDWVLQVEK
jgi:hypothetical protein